MSADDLAHLDHDEMVGIIEDLEAEVLRLTIEIHGCGCPAPYDQCPHDQPLTSRISGLEADREHLGSAVVGLFGWLRDLDSDPMELPSGYLGKTGDWRDPVCVAADAAFFHDRFARGARS